MRWMFHAYQPSTNILWGWGYENKIVWEYVGRWVNGELVNMTWRIHDNHVLSNMEKTIEISICRRSIEQMEAIIPNFENKILGTFLYLKMGETLPVKAT